jgi:hypothetical protein
MMPEHHVAAAFEGPKDRYDRTPDEFNRIMNGPAGRPRRTKQI